MRERALDFDDMDLDGIFGFDKKGEHDHLGPPDFRATIHDGELLVTTGPPTSNGGGPTIGWSASGPPLEWIADMWLNGDEAAELIVEYLALADRRRADRRLPAGRRPSATTGSGCRIDWYLRVRPAAGLGQVVCPTCGMAWEDEGPEFWNAVRSSGRFPTVRP